MKKIAILGSTGSIGTNALRVLASLKNEFEVTALSADSNIALISDQARKFNARFVCVGTEKLAKETQRKLPRGTRVVCGQDGLRQIVASCGADIFIIAISGTAAIIPLVEAIKKGKRIALANKEALISAGPVIMSMARKTGAEILPVDSEHSAIFQCLDGKREYLSKIYLTGSGGPLLSVDKKRFDRIKKKDILNHPKWKMGEKISVDSATMMNKGLEIIEAQYLFGVCEEKIEVLIHPEAIIHSMVEFSDGSVLAHLAVPDMRIPIQFALTYPARMPVLQQGLEFEKIKALSFRAPDTDKFPCLELARHASRKGGTYPAVLCAADEEAVKCYLDGEIRFTEISKTIDKVISRHRDFKRTAISLADVLDAGEWAKEEARSICCH